MCVYVSAGALAKLKESQQGLHLILFEYLWDTHYNDKCSGYAQKRSRNGLMDKCTYLSLNGDFCQTQWGKLKTWLQEKNQNLLILDNKPINMVVPIIFFLNVMKVISLIIILCYYYLRCNVVILTPGWVN